MLNSIIGSQITATAFMICTAVSVVLGLLTAAVSMYRSPQTQSTAITLCLLPVTVQTVIMLVNGNVGAGVAVAGAFSLVRFRSAPGSAKEIAVIFIAMAIGLATGMGFVALAAVFFIICALLLLILPTLHFGDKYGSYLTLKITVPEDADFDGLFDDIFEKYTKSYTLQKVKLSNMGTLYDLVYEINLKTAEVPKSFIDELRCRNSNLNIVCCRDMPVSQL